jgi:hypothetical protein
MDPGRGLGDARVLNVGVLLQEQDRQQNVENQERAPTGRLRFHSCCYIEMVIWFIARLQLWFGFRRARRNS